MISPCARCEIRANRTKQQQQTPVLFATWPPLDRCSCKRVRAHERQMKLHGQNSSSSPGCSVGMEIDGFVTKRPRTPTDDDAGAKKSNKLPASTAKVTKPKEHEFVGAGAIQRLDASTLTVALDALEKVDEHCKTLVTTARMGGANLLVEPPRSTRTLSSCAEFVVRRRIAVKSADTILHNLKDKVGSSWTPKTVMSHEPVLREYMKVGEGASGKVDTILELARLFASPSAPTSTR